MDKLKKFIKEIYPYVIIIVLVLIFKMYYYSPIRVDGTSMSKTLINGDIMILDIVSYRHNAIKRFDIVVVDDGEEYIIKRVIGLPGETVEYKDNQLFINGKKVEDKYPYGKTADFKVKVEKDKYYVLGDNRNNSLDSRYFGAFKKNKIIGKTNFTVFPFNRFGKKK